jgi:hypothetical protein
MTAPQRAFVLPPLISERVGDQECTESVSISSTELASLRRRPLAREEFHNPPDAPRFRAIGRTFDGFLIVVGDPQD